MEACGDPHRPHGWITPAFVDAYEVLHRLGWTHSVEVYDADGSLVGGLYGVRIGRFFAGESMFHVRRDASKVALVALVELMQESGATLLDVQWTTPHLVSLGAVDIDRRDVPHPVGHGRRLNDDRGSPGIDAAGLQRQRTPLPWGVWLMCMPCTM